MLSNIDDTWKIIVRIHNEAKNLVLKAEELDPEKEFFFPTAIQQRDAYDHAIRIKSAKLRIQEFATEQKRAEYIEISLERILAHEYRAFSDIADWVSIIYRNKISGIIEKYPPECIDAVIKDYYPQIYPRMEKIHREIIAIREKKDIGSRDKMLSQATEYGKIIEGLDADWSRIADSMGALEQRYRKYKFSGIRRWLLGIIAGIIIALAGAAVAYFFFPRS